MRVAWFALALVVTGCGVKFDYRNFAFYQNRGAFPRPRLARSPPFPDRAAVSGRFDFSMPCGEPDEVLASIARRAGESGFVVSKLNETLHLSNGAAILVITRADKHLHVTCWSDERETCAREYARAAGSSSP